MRFDAGRPISVAMTKWGGRRHWRYDGVYLGADEHGDWLGFPRGTHYHRPGKELVADFACVSLAPRRDAAHFAGFYDEDYEAALYVDVTTPPEWDGTTLRMVDLDLDVIALRDERGLVLADEDEFEQHRIELEYPAEIVALAEESAERVYAAVAAGEPPYDGSAERWLAALAALG
ncbi:MAG TPA: DUF402 domain-containing protein [Nocardioides sp.]|uniref:DUF402 domain-containing protein n=1 Tax=Nocardioides sp. TaxID=35761 RepID=UPI002ED8AEA4